MTRAGLYKPFSAEQPSDDKLKNLFRIEKYDYPTLKAKAEEAFYYALGLAKRILADAQKLRRYSKEKGNDLTKYTLNEIKEKS